MTAAPTRFPAEWEPQAAVLLAWPHEGTDWAPRLAAVEARYVELIRAIARFEPVVLCVADAAVGSRATAMLSAAGIASARIRTVEVSYDDTWLRDSGPITLLRADGGFDLLDFRFTGWGGKYRAGRDDALVEALTDRKLFVKSTLQSIDFALEGGAIETDGGGTLLTTWRCLHERHPRATRASLEQTLRGALNQHRVLWLEHGYLEGDDTDAHIDTLARFADPTTIVYQGCDDVGDSHHAELAAMAAELAAFRRDDGAPYRLLALPWPRPIRDGERRLAASYANFLIVNGAVLMPGYDDPADGAAASVLAQAFPDRQIMTVPCRDLIWQNGSLHCLTMQLPRGVVDV